jgi:hypothetical protein
MVDEVGGRESDVCVRSDCCVVGLESVSSDAPVSGRLPLGVTELPVLADASE